MCSGPNSASLDVLQYAAYRWRENHSQVLLILNVRSEALHPQADAQAFSLVGWLNGLQRDLPFERLTLEPLSAQHTVKLLNNLTQTGEQAATNEFGQWLFTETGRATLLHNGNPQSYA